MRHLVVPWPVDQIYCRPNCKTLAYRARRTAGLLPSLSAGARVSACSTTACGWPSLTSSSRSYWDRVAEGIHLRVHAGDEASP